MKEGRNCFSQSLGSFMNRKIILAIIVLMIVFLGTALVLWLRIPKDYSGKMESITIAYSPFESTGLLWIADDQHAFSRNGLNATLRKYDTGVGSLDGLLKGEADIAAGVAEFPLVGRALQKAKIRIVGNIDKADFIYLVGRKDRGIAKASDLKGKKVGTTFRTVAHFYLGRFLDLNGMNAQDITLVDIRTPEGWVNAVANGDIDAISTAQPYAKLAKERLGDQAVVWPVQSGQFVHGLVISSNEWITKHPEVVTRLLKSLAQAEEYVIRNPAQAKAVIQKRLNLDAAYMETVWSQNQFSLSLDQSLITTMEDEARWMIKNKLTDAGEVPDFLNHIYEDALKAIKPEAVNIIR